MAKDRNDLPELTDEELAFEMIEITCEEMDYHRLPIERKAEA